MELVTSRGYMLPVTAETFANSKWYNLWLKRLWPYNSLSVGDKLHWYESLGKCVVWRSHVSAVTRFPYQHKNEVRERLELTDSEASQAYFTEAPDAGFCLSYNIEPEERLRLLKPDGFRFPQAGWLQVDEEIAAAWPGLSILQTSQSTKMTVAIESGSSVVQSNRHQLELFGEYVTRANVDWFAVFPDKLADVQSTAIANGRMPNLVVYRTRSGDDRDHHVVPLSELTGLFTDDALTHSEVNGTVRWNVTLKNHVLKVSYASIPKE